MAISQIEVYKVKAFKRLTTALKAFRHSIEVQKGQKSSLPRDASDLREPENL